MRISRGSAIVCILFGLLVATARAQRSPGGSSIQRAEVERHAGYGALSEAEWDSVNGYHPPSLSASSIASLRSPSRNPLADCTLDRIVFGWSPSWVGTAYKQYDYSLLSDVCYFSYEVDPNSGSYTTVGNWKTTELVPIAKAAGTRVHLCATLFSGHTTFLGNSASKSRMIDSLIALVRLRGADGVNIDFEGMPASVRGSFAQFMIDLSTRLHKAVPGSRVSIALPAVDWSNVFDVALMAPHVDLFLIMGYDYHWKGADQAGPVAPKNSGSLWGSIDVTRSVYSYLGRGVPASKLCLAVPYYGYEWPTADSTAGASAQGAGVSVTYATAKQNAAALGRRWDIHSSTPYYVRKADGDPLWKQTWYDDAESLGLKYDLVLTKNLAGIGIWALSYDGTLPDLWDAIESRFTGCRASACQGTLTDIGGPTGNYVDNDSYTFTIAPENAASVKLSFYSFSIANDRLRIFNGRDTLAPLLGSYTGEANPGTVTASSGAITVKFTSDSAKNSWGWVANWSCTSKPQGVGEPGDAASPSLRIEPNPAGTSTTVYYFLPSWGTVELGLYDLLGRRLAVLAQGKRDPGEYRAVVSRTALGLAAGSYLVRLTVAGQTVTQKLEMR